MPFDEAILEQIRTEAGAAWGTEVCGALIGNNGEVRTAVRIVNHSIDPERGFLIPAEDVLRIERAAETQGQAVLGFYHSHPAGNAEPSSADLENAVPGYLYLILSGNGDARAWRLREDRSAFDEVIE